MARPRTLIPVLLVTGVAVLAAARLLNRPPVRVYPAHPTTAENSTVLVFALARVPLWRFEPPAARAGKALRAQGVTTVLVRIPGAQLRDDATAARWLANTVRPLLQNLPRARTVLGGYGGAAGAALHAAAGLDSVAALLLLSGQVRERVQRPLGVPAILVAAAGDDAGRTPLESRQLARSLASGGAAVSFVIIPDRTPASLADFSIGDDAVKAMLAFMRGQPAPAGIDPRWAGLPPAHDVSTTQFEAGALVRRQPPTLELRLLLWLVLGAAGYELNAYAFDSYQAVDLLDYLASRPSSEVGTGDHLVITNVRGERIYLTRAELVRLRPQVVVGLDDETDLFRLLAAYQPRLSYSWLADSAELPWMMRRVGGLLHFPQAQPALYPSGISVAAGLTPASFRWQHDDPLASVRALPAMLRNALIGETGCLHCHSLRDTGAAGRHITMADPARSGGGRALALEAYPAQVLHAFLFDQERVARKFGARPLDLSAQAAGQLEALVRGR